MKNQRRLQLVNGSLDQSGRVYQCFKSDMVIPAGCYWPEFSIVLPPPHSDDNEMVQNGKAVLAKAS